MREVIEKHRFSYDVCTQKYMDIEAYIEIFRPAASLFKLPYLTQGVLLRYRDGGQA